MRLVYAIAAFLSTWGQFSYTMIMSDQHLYSLPRPKPWYKKWWGVFIIIVLAIGLIFTTAVVLQVRNDLKNLPKTQSADTIDVVTTDDLTIGPPNAPITIVEFGDFNCPYCRQSFPVMKQLLKEYAGKIRFIYRDLPILSQSSFDYALAVECAQDQGQAFGWAMHDLLFVNQGAVPEDFSTIYSQQLSLDAAKFSTCFNQRQYLDEIRADMIEGRKAGALATPTFFINGHKVSGHQSIDSWRSAINYLLQNN